MKKYRVYNLTGYLEFNNDEQSAINYHSQFGIGEIEEIEISLSTWSKENYSKELNEAHNTLFTQYYLSRDYVNIGEIVIWLDDDVYGEEATKLINWWKITSKDLLDYLKIVTEETAIPIEDYINSLPIIEF